VNILLLSTGGGGGNILRSLKTLFRRDLIVAQKADPRYAERVRKAVVTRFLDTNEFSLADVPKEERVLIGPRITRRLGSMHDPALAREALEESRQEVEALLARYSVIVVVGTGGKGTGAGTIFPLAQMARKQGKLVIPIFVRPSFERHEVEKQRYDHALRVVRQFDAAKFRLVEILNDCGYVDADPQPQAVVWERMNRPIARALRGWLYVLSDLSQVDPSDLSLLFAGEGRLRIGFAEIDPPAGNEPSDKEIEEAVRVCWDNPYYAFSEPVGTSLLCIQGDWSNVVDGKIKGRLAALASSRAVEGTYNPLYARASNTPRPWGVTAVFAEYTGKHQPLLIDWPIERNTLVSTGRFDVAELVTVNSSAVEVTASTNMDQPSLATIEPSAEDVGGSHPETTETSKTAGEFAFSRFWEFAFALNRSDPRALAVAGGDECGLAIDAMELRKLLGTMWFPPVFPHLSRAWRERMLDALVEDVVVPNHVLKAGRETLHVSELGYDRLREMLKTTHVPDAIRADLQLLVAVGSLWGKEALGRFKFISVSPEPGPSKIALLMHPFRHT
jgi:cell division GTPase FtsZ